MKKIFTLLCFLVPLTLLDVSHAWAQRGDRGLATARRQRQKPHFDLTRIRSEKLAKFSLPAKLPDFKNKGTQTSDTTKSRMRRHIQAMKNRPHTVRPRLAAARKSASADIPSTLYVNYKATGTGEGDTWENAFPELADALVFAKDHPEVQKIWVANGIYYPLYDHNYSADGDDPKDKTFILPTGVKLYGGFTGTEALLTERRLRIQPLLDFDLDEEYDFATILSGEGEFDNYYHVVTAAGDVGDGGLDGFFITYGRAVGDDAVTVHGEDVPRSAGGGLVAVNSSPSLSNLTFIYNTAIDGSAMAGIESNFVLTNALIVYNDAFSQGTINVNNSSPVITNATIFFNNENEYGGILFRGAGTIGSVRNTIIYQNDDYGSPQIGLLDGAVASIANSIVQGSGGSSAWDTTFGTDDGNNLDEDPQFEDISTDHYGLYLTSPAINKGNNAYFNAGQTPDLSALTTDQSGAPRISKGTIDIGALESPYETGYHSDLVPDENGILYVKKGGAGTMTGDSWDNAAPEVADALFASVFNFDVVDIWVAGGTYHPLYRPDDFSKSGTPSPYNSFLLVDGVNVYGGFAGTEESLEERDLTITANASILSGDFNGDDDFDITEIAQSGPDAGSGNAYMLVSAVGSTCTCGVALNGITIEGANNLAAAAGETLRINDHDIPLGLAAGFLVIESNATLENIVIRNNVGKMAGGMTFYDAGGLMLSSLIYHNVEAGNVIFRNDGYGGASGVLNISNNTNAPGNNPLILLNTTIARNLSMTSRPGLQSVLVLYVLGNSIVYGNLVAGGLPDDGSHNVGGGYSLGQAGNNIIGGSGGSDNWQLDPAGNDLYIGDLGENFDEDPLFTDIDAGDFSLTACSRAVDGGIDISGFTEDTGVDIAGNPRMFGDYYDMGAYEFQGAPGGSLTELAGNGKESLHEFADNSTYTFTAEKGICSVDILTLTPVTLIGGVRTKVWYDAQVNSFNSAPYLQRHYDIIPANDPENVSAEVTLYFTQAEFDALNEKLDPSDYLPTGAPAGEGTRKGNFRIYQFHGESSDGSGMPSTYGGTRKEINPDDSKIVWNEELHRWEVTFTVTGFSGFFAGTASQNPLPVKLVSFEGKQTDNQQIRLDWKVVEQESIAAYQVEYSETGKTFRKIGQVAANTLSSYDYTYTDSLTHTGDHSYYRLKIAELDGKTAYSKIVSIKLNAAQTISAYPIPARNELWIDWKKTGTESAELVDMSGRTLKTVKKISASQRVDISGLPAGIFVLKVKGNVGLKVVKE